MSTTEPSASALTGDNCPESGIWRVCSAPENLTSIEAGEIMPPYEGKVVTWVLIERRKS